MSDYPEPKRGDWVAFHRDPVYGPTCHHGCRAPGGHAGYPWVGQVEDRHHELIFGRAAYRVRFWHEIRRGEGEALTTVLAADHLSAIVVRTTQVDLEGAA
ncbi:hypothetical protein ABT324_08875 [Saccharopolyspora sp. NPDC000359]|uniref:hypothetical protein n=1 Tax=Saccharopolyspora sp. NPDC000359 TaxID=3154251 RepID=UPI003316622F